MPPCSSDQLRKRRIKNALACEHETSLQKRPFSVALHKKIWDERYFGKEEAEMEREEMKKAKQKTRDVIE